MAEVRVEPYRTCLVRIAGPCPAVRAYEPANSYRDATYSQQRAQSCSNCCSSRYQIQRQHFPVSSYSALTCVESDTFRDWFLLCFPRARGLFGQVKSRDGSCAYSQKIPGLECVRQVRRRRARLDQRDRDKKRRNGRRFRPGKHRRWS
jgi:hypothetical protein